MRHYETVDGLTTTEACHVLFDLAKNVADGESIVEVGVFKGRSLLALAEGAVAGEGQPVVVGVDPWNLPRPSKPKYASDETYQAALDNVAASPAGWLVVLSRSFGVDAAERFDTQNYGEIGLWYLDADHRRLPVLADFAAWAPHFAPGAVVCFDDHDLRTFPGVVEAVAILVKTGRITEPVMMTDRLAVSRFIQ